MVYSHTRLFVKTLPVILYTKKKKRKEKKKEKIAFARLEKDKEI
jgi:hypothetical protein